MVLNSNNIVQVNGVGKYYGSKNNKVQILDSVNLEIKEGDFCLILGRSGSGKSTLLNLMAGLDKVSSGNIVVMGQDLTKMSQGKLSKYRGGVGIIFQNYSLLPNLNALENVLMGSWASGKKGDKTKAINMMTKFGLGQRIKAKVETLSGGEKQRTAIVRAVVDDAKILFCDEPTGALDTKNEAQIMLMLSELNQAGTTIVCVTHNPEFKNLASLVVDMSDGKIISTERKTKSTTSTFPVTQTAPQLTLKLN
jgi:putative ABC transport system ATP-binding protein